MTECDHFCSELEKLQSRIFGMDVSMVYDYLRTALFTLQCFTDLYLSLHFNFSYSVGKMQWVKYLTDANSPKFTYI